MTRSLRWRLQLWHAFILTAVVLLFGAAFYDQFQRSMLREIDADLLSNSRIIEGALRTVDANSIHRAISFLPLDLPGGSGSTGTYGPSPPPPGPGPPGQRGPRDEPGLHKQHNIEDEQWFRPKLRQPERDESGPPPRDAYRAMTPRESAPNHFQRMGPPYYYAVYTFGGELLRRNFDSPQTTFALPRQPLTYRVLDDRREVLLRGPHATLIIVGRDIRPVFQRLRDSLLQLIAIGVAVLCLGLLGGWWLAGRAIRPIADISRTAALVSAESLSARVETAHMDTELRSLGETLNSMLVRLENSFRQQTQFTADASHELRTPLAVILSQCELALNRTRSNEEYILTIGSCRKAAERMQHLITGLLTLARADAGKLELNLTAADLNSLAADAISLLAPLAQERSIALQLQGSAVICQVDRERVSQVMLNLIQNAIYYSQPGSEVMVTTAVEAAKALFRVADNGIGIPPEALPFLFDRFYRVDASRSRSDETQLRQGSGLGLAICKSIIDAHHGTISVDSQVGRGTVFEVNMPLAAPPDSR